MPEPPIAALATPPIPAERAVIRLSGQALLAHAQQWLPPGLQARGQRGASSGFLEWAPGVSVPAALLEFPAPASATGEDVLEIHLPGDPPVVQRVLQGLFERGVRPAEPGEFTRRAFLRGRLDLVQAEAVLELVSATDAEEARAAAEVLQGALGLPLADAVAALDQASVALEASLDFEEGDAQDVRADELEPLLETAAAALAQGQAVEERRRPMRQGFRIVLRGETNCGKSTLFNLLTQSTAQVSHEAGTTRDRLEAAWQPIPEATDWILCDTPGVGGAPVDERDAAARRREEADSADLWWLMADSRQADAQIPDSPGNAPALVLWTCADAPRGVSESALQQARKWGPTVWVSGKEGTGISELIRLAAESEAQARGRRSARLAAGSRHDRALQEAGQHLRTAVAARRRGEPLDWVAQELRAARQALVVLVGEFTPEDLLDQIFARFCLGK